MEGRQGPRQSFFCNRPYRAVEAGVRIALNRPMGKLLGSILFSLLLSPLVVLAEEAPSDWTLKAGCTAAPESLSLKLNSEIRPPLADNLEIYLRACPDLKKLELRLNSPGGSIVETSRLAEILDKAKSRGIQVTTRVDNGDECDSSCIPLYAQGNKRQAGPVAAFMFHGVAIYLITNIPDPDSTKELLDLVRKASGLNKVWLQGLIDKKIFSVPSMYWLSGQELMDQKSGFVTELLERQQLLTPYDHSYRKF